MRSRSRRFAVVFLACVAVAGTAVAGFSFAALIRPRGTGKAAVTEINVSEQEYSISLTDGNGNMVTSVPAGQVIFHVKNNGTIEHDFAISGHDTTTIEPGASADLTVTLQPGDANYLCTIGEHASLGMIGVLHVTGQVQTTTAVITTNGTTITTTNTQTQSTPTQTPTATIDVSEKEFKIMLPTATKVVKGKRVKVVKPVKHGLIRFVVTNVGKISHNFVIGTGQTTLLKPGQKQAITVNLAKGNHKYLCSVQGHAALGMKGTLVAT
jgi:uncharacterized cupredoxin-like copper-binding protein